ncbi:MAG: ABC transporter permease, partial [Acidimicrobiia bacterium]
MTLEARRFVADQFWLRHLAFAVLLFGAWEVYARVLDEPVLLPGPTAVLSALVAITVDGRLFPALLESLRLLAIGFVTAALFGIVFGVLVGRYKLMDRTFSPYFNGLYAL